jgi:hypothetical protein
MINKRTTLASLIFVAAIGSAIFDGTYAQTQEPALSSTTPNSVQQELEINDIDMANQFFGLLVNFDPIQVGKILSTIEDNWSVEYLPMAIEALGFAQSDFVRTRLAALIETETPKDKFDSVNDRYQWLWNQNIKAPKGYANFKADLYQHIDEKFETYFRDRQDSARVRLDEIRWGGVVQDGIPPLRSPEMVSAEQADYLDGNNIVFGIEINGDARAYPKRILAWHEMFVDTIGGVDIAGVYCTLCGTVIPYRTEFKGTKYQLGTSGFLYRSNKLMYDQATQSLWSTSRGVPVLGPLVDKGIELEFESVVTTTWAEWRKRHPKTSVLSLNTGHLRNYDEGNAYNEYFSTDRLMFSTPFNDKRLKNKQEVLALRFPAAPEQQMAIDTKYLNKHTVYENRIGQQKFVVLTDKTGANRVYDPKDIKFKKYDGDSTVVDNSGQPWTVNESWLEAKNGDRLERLPYRRAFWFGWHAAFPETKLVK